MGGFGTNNHECQRIRLRELNLESHMFPCRRYTPLPLDRRSFLRQAGCGFGAVALAALWTQRDIAGAEAKTDGPSQPHFKPRAKSVIYLYMDGGPSQVDTFDPKPRLNK